MKQLRPAVLLLLLLLLWPAGAGAAPALPHNAIPGELILKLQPGSALSSAARASGAQADALNALLRGAGAGIAQDLGSASATYRVRLPATTDLIALSAALEASSAVVYAEPNYTRAMMITPDDPVITQQWALRDIHAYEAWDITTGSDSIAIALLDTGVSSSHPDLKSKLLRGHDFYNNDDDANDDEGHGTYTAGVAAASTNNGTGIAGICWKCKILPVKVLGSRGQGDDATIAAGIRWAVDQGVRIISMSLGGEEDTAVLRDAVNYAHDRNVLIIAASGNGQGEGNLPNYPAAYPGVLAVSATNSTDGVTGFSTTGSFVGIAAPGVGLWSTLWTPTEGNTYGVANGTSAACPHVAGAAALALSLRPDLSADQLAQVLEAGADDEGAPGRDPEYGYGRLNLLRAVQIAADPNVLSHSRIQGVVTGAQGQVTVALSNGQQTQTDAGGGYHFDNLPAGAYTVSVSGPGGSVAPQQTYVSGTVLSIATINFSFGPDAAQFFVPVGPPTDGSTFFPQTGHTLRGTLLAYWGKNGGLPIFGYPTSEEFVERGEDGHDYTVQYFERHKLELHPENRAPYNVLLSRLGDTILQQSGRNWFDFPKTAPQPGCQFFAETGHSICAPFLNYWRTHGLDLDGRRGTTAAESLALFGQPLSDAQVETLADGQSYIVQWFERARFESHGDQGVLLGLLANDLASARGWRR